MNGLLITLALTAVGVDFSWETATDGELEYTLEIERDLATAISSGEQIVSGIPRDVRQGKRIRIWITNPNGNSSSVAPIVGVAQHGAKRLADNRLEYIVQIPPDAFQAMASGRPLIATLGAEFRATDRLRVLVGRTRLPQLSAAEMATLAKADAAKSQLGAPLPKTHQRTSSTFSDRGGSFSGLNDIRRDSNVRPAQFSQAPVNERVRIPENARTNPAGSTGQIPRQSPTTLPQSLAPRTNTGQAALGSGSRGQLPTTTSNANANNLRSGLPNTTSPNNLGGQSALNRTTNTAQVPLPRQSQTGWDSNVRRGSNQFVGNGQTPVTNNQPNSGQGFQQGNGQVAQPRWNNQQQQGVANAQPVNYPYNTQPGYNAQPGYNPRMAANPQAQPGSQVGLQAPQNGYPQGSQSVLAGQKTGPTMPASMAWPVNTGVNPAQQQQPTPATSAPANAELNQRLASLTKSFQETQQQLAREREEREREKREQERQAREEEIRAREKAETDRKFKELETSLAKAQAEKEDEVQQVNLKNASTALKPVTNDTTSGWLVYMTFLVASVCGNIYLIWIASDYYSQYRHMADEIRSSRTRDD